MFKTHLAISTYVAAMLILNAQPAYAYLDPGTGGMLLQIILGGAAGIAVAGKLFWHQIKSFFSARSSNHAGDTSKKTDT